MSAADREFTFSDFERLTPDLAPHERLAVFLNLEPQLQDEAWRVLDERVERDGRALWAEERLGSCTAAELAAEIEMLWAEVSAVPLAGLETSPIAAPVAQRTPHPADEDFEVLRSIPSAEYVPMLTGHEVARGYVSCPLHEERSPSLHVSDQDGRWYCFGCAAGGDIFDFVAALDGRSAVPNGREFVEFARDVAAALAGGRSWR